MRFAKAGLNAADLRSFRQRFPDLPLIRWPEFERLCITLPLRVIRTLFFRPLWLFIFGITFSLNSRQPGNYTEPRIIACLIQDARCFPGLGKLSVRCCPGLGGRPKGRQGLRHRHTLCDGAPYRVGSPFARPPASRRLPWYALGQHCFVSSLFQRFRCNPSRRL